MLPLQSRLRYIRMSGLGEVLLQWLIPRTQGLRAFQRPQNLDYLCGETLYLNNYLLFFEAQMTIIIDLRSINK